MKVFDKTEEEWYEWWQEYIPICIANRLKVKWELYGPTNKNHKNEKFLNLLLIYWMLNRYERYER